MIAKSSRKSSFQKLRCRLRKELKIKLSLNTKTEFYQPVGEYILEKPSGWTHIAIHAWMEWGGGVP